MEMRMEILMCIGWSLFVASMVGASENHRDLRFIDACSRNDPKLGACLETSINTLVEHFRNGLIQLNYTEVEPIILDEVHISLGGGPDGYKAQFKDVAARGVSALRIIGVRAKIEDEKVELQLTLRIPKIRAAAKYRSSGTLILVKASGAGDYWGEYDGVTARVYIAARPYMNGGRKFLSLQKLDMNFRVRNIKMGVENVQDQNTILQAALNLFINSNSQELLKEMKPDLRRKLVQVMTIFVQKLFDQVPYDAWISD